MLPLHLSGITDNTILVEYQRYGTTEILRLQIDVIIARRSERERGRETERDREKQTETERDIQRQRETDRERQTD